MNGIGIFGKTEVQKILIFLVVWELVAVMLIPKNVLANSFG